MKTPSPITMLAGIIMLAVSSPLFGRQDGEFLKGYVITIEHDTIHGWILLKDHQYNINTCTFRSSPEGVGRNYTPEEIMAYSIEDKKYFYSHEITRNLSVVESFKRQKVFLECLVKGSVSLYFFEGRYFMQTPGGMKELTRSETQVVNDGKKYVSRQPEYSLRYARQWETVYSLISIWRRLLFQNRVSQKYLSNTTNARVGARSHLKPPVKLTG